VFDPRTFPTLSQPRPLFPPRRAVPYARDPPRSKRQRQPVNWTSSGATAQRRRFDLSYIVQLLQRSVVLELPSRAVLVSAVVVKRSGRVSCPWTWEDGAFVPCRIVNIVMGINPFRPWWTRAERHRRPGRLPPRAAATWAAGSCKLRDHRRWSAGLQRISAPTRHRQPIDLRPNAVLPDDTQTGSCRKLV
jgi:hypothetical protein